DTDYREEVMFYAIRAYFNFANQSVKDKRIERYEEAIDRYEKFIARYPASKYLKDASAMKERSLKMITENN
ncbi:MAG: outer membrane protein assembly factor BamD, partial [Bacteroidales bacterium]